MGWLHPLGPQVANLWFEVEKKFELVAFKGKPTQHATPRTTPEPKYLCEFWTSLNRCELGLQLRDVHRNGETFGERVHDPFICSRVLKRTGRHATRTMQLSFQVTEGPPFLQLSGTMNEDSELLPHRSSQLPMPGGL